MNQKLGKKLLIALTILAILLLSNFSYAADVCFKEETANKILIELEKGRIDSDELNICKKINTEKDTQINILIEKDAAKDIQLNSCKNTVSEYQTLRENDKKACDEKVKDAKPSLTTTVLYTLSIFGAGLLVALLL